MHHMMTGVHLFLEILIAAVTLHVANAWPAASQALTHVRQGAQRSKAPSAGLLLAAEVGAEHDTEEMHDVEPFLVTNAVVQGPVSALEQEKLMRYEAVVHHSSGAGHRTLLHGANRLRAYPVCNRCRMLTCNQRRFCEGHCKKNGSLNRCNTNTDTTPFAPPLCSDDDASTATAKDTMGKYDTAIVTVPAPYIGCADIGGRPTGCPAPGTAATLPDGRQGMVIVSTCRSETYVPDCPGPLIPFGICLCVYDIPPPAGTRPVNRVIFEPCDTTVLAALTGEGVDGSDGFGSDEGPVVEPGGNVTQTWYSNYTLAVDTPNHTHTVTATSRSIDVVATLKYFSALLVPVQSDELEEEFVVEDYVLIEYTAAAPQYY